jgi:ATP-dependent protease ClpP protease subunit
VITKFIVLLGVLLSATSFAASKKPDPRQIYIQDVIDGPSMVEASDKLWMLSKVSKKPINIIINSPGGSVYAGFQFINAMLAAQQRGVTLKCYVSGIAMSMAFQILTYCDHRYALRYSLLLWHPPRISGFSSFTVERTKSIYRELVAIEKQLVPQLLKTLGLPKRFFMLHYHEETVWTAIRLRRIAPEFLRIVTVIPGATTVWNLEWSNMQDCVDYCKTFDWRLNK